MASKVVAKKLTPGQKAALTRKLHQKQQAKAKPSAKAQAKQQAKQRKKKLVPFGGKVVNIASLITALQAYGKHHRTQGIAPTEVVRISWAVIKKAAAPAKVGKVKGNETRKK